MPARRRSGPGETGSGTAGGSRASSPPVAAWEPRQVRLLARVVPKPLIRQGVLLAPVLVDLMVMALRGNADSAGRAYVAGLALLIAATGVAALARVRGVPELFLRRLPMVDLAALGLMALAPGGTAVELLAVLPAMWLGADRRLRGVACAVGGSLLLISLPSLLFTQSAAGDWSMAALLPMICGMVAVTVAGTAEVWERQNGDLEEQGRRLEAALAEVIANRALNDAIVTTVDVGLIALDRRGQHLSVNPRLEEFLALAYPDGRTEDLGRVGSIFAADRVTRLGRPDMPTVRAMAGETFSDYVIWVGEDPEHQRALSVAGRPIHRPDGVVDGAVLVFQDVTDLVSALAVKDDFVASVSHELRTPLTAIMGFLDLVLDDDDAVEGPVRRQLEIVRRNAQRLLGLVSDLLLSAQAERGQMILSLVSIDASALVDQAVAEAGPRARTGQVALVSEVDRGLVVRADPLRLRQLVDNLVTNAVKYTPPGGTVMVRLTTEADGLVLSVADTGIGISEGDQRRLYTRFFRGEEAVARAIPGVGLGLAITHTIVEAHEGHIEVDSTVGQGTTFRVRLPLHGPIGVLT